MSAEQIRLVAIALGSCLSTSIVSTVFLWLVVLGSARLSERRAELEQRASERMRRTGGAQ